jgi:hypothetical protein
MSPSVSEDVSLLPPPPPPVVEEKKETEEVVPVNVRRHRKRPSDPTPWRNRQEAQKPYRPVVDKADPQQQQLMDDLTVYTETTRRGLIQTNKRKMVELAALQTQRSSLREKIQTIYDVPGTQSSQDTVIDEDQAAELARELTTVGKKMRKVEKEVAFLEDQIDRVGRTTMYAKQVFDHQAESKDVAFKIFERLHRDIRSFGAAAAVRYDSAKQAHDHTVDLPQANSSLARAIASERKASNAITDAMRGVQVALWPLVQLTTTEQQKQLVKDNNHTFLMAFDEAGRQNKDADTESDRDR